MHYLKTGDIVDVIAPGYPCLPEEVEGAKNFLKQWGLVPRIPADLIGKHFIHANSDEKRFSHLKAAINSSDSKVIWCLRGGYGSNRLLPLLAKMKKPRHEKNLIGISDITSLHTFVNQEWGWKTLHGPLLDRLGKGQVPTSIQKELKALVFGAQDHISFKKLKALNSAALNLKKIKTSVVGGNLTVIQGSIGTPWQINIKGRLLFVEDIGERGYRFDRIFEQMRQAGMFKACQGLILGDFIGGVEPKTGKDNFNLVFKRWAADLEIPVFTGFEAGHGMIQRPVPLGTEAILHKSTDGKNKFILDISNV